MSNDNPDYYDAKSSSLTTISIAIALIIAIIGGIYLTHSSKGQTTPKATSATDKTIDDDDNDDDKNAIISKRQQQQSKNKKNAAKKPKKDYKKNKISKPKPTSHPRFLRKFGGHGHGNVLAMAISPNGEWMATSGTDGQLRTTRITTTTTTSSSNNTNTPPTVFLNTQITPYKNLNNISWCNDNRTLLSTFEDDTHMVFYRMRRKNNSLDDNNNNSASSSGAFPYELIPLSKHVIQTNDKLDDLSTTIALHRHHNHTSRSGSGSGNVSFPLVLTSGTSKNTTTVKTVVLWDGHDGTPLGSIKLPSSSSNNDDHYSSSFDRKEVRCSRDGSYLSSRHGGKVIYAKRKRVKGEVRPIFDRWMVGKGLLMAGGLSSSSSQVVVDVSFFQRGGGDDDNDDHNGVDYAVVVTEGGDLAVYNVNDIVTPSSSLSMEPLCQLNGCEYMTSNDNDDDDNINATVLGMATSGDGRRMAVVTNDNTMYVLSYSDDGEEQRCGAVLALDVVIRGVHTVGIKDVQFSLDGSADVVYTLGVASKEVFAWDVTVGSNDN